MATESRLEGAPLTPAGASAPAGQPPPLQPTAPLAAALWAEPTGFDFFQAVRLLERLLPGRAPVGEFGDPADEVVRFAVPPGAAFPASEILALEPPPAPDEPARMTVTFMGLTGPTGVLPLPYTSELADRARARDDAMRDFFDLFHHRFVSLFYRAWEKYRFAIAHERDRRDRLTHHLLDLLGLGTAGLQRRLPLRDETLIFYAGLLTAHTRTAAGLEQMLSDYFDVPVAVEQFVGAWYPLESASLSRLGEEEDALVQLGVGAVVGDEIWDQQSRVRLRVGPMPRRRYDEFLPTGPAYAALRSLARFYVGDELDVEACLVLTRDDVPPCVLGAEPDEATPLGWSTWLRSRPMARDPGDTVLTL